MSDYMWLSGVLAVILIIPVKFLVPKMMDTDNANLRFGIGVVLFLIYTALVLLVLSFFNMFRAEGTDAVTDRIYFVKYTIGILLVNLSALFTACLYFFTRVKRKLSEAEKMKLKDM